MQDVSIKHNVGLIKTREHDTDLKFTDNQSMIRKKLFEFLFCQHARQAISFWRNGCSNPTTTDILPKWISGQLWSKNPNIIHRQHFHNPCMSDKSSIKEKTSTQLITIRGVQNRILHSTDPATRCWKLIM